MKKFGAILCSLVLAIQAANSSSVAGEFTLQLRSEQAINENLDRFHRVEVDETWSASETAVIVCDMWDSHHCVNAVRRVAQLAPRIDSFCNAWRDQGATIIHAPSSCLEAYANHPARERAAATPIVEQLPPNIGNWCDQIPSEESAAYPVDQSAGGEDDDPQDHAMWAARLEAIGRNPRAPWKQQTAGISIDAGRDFISDQGDEIWSILTHRKIQNVILVGVHTNMCVLGRPFGLRQMASNGKNVVLCRDLTDTMYDPNAWPYVSHFTGTDLVIRHVERFVCPTISSEQVLGGQPLRFAKDDRLRLAMIIAEDEYETETTLPKFAAKHLGQHFSVTTCFGDSEERHRIRGLEAVDNADAILISVRRRALPPEDLARLRVFVAAGKPVIGIRTASHAFSLRGKAPPADRAVWETFDADVFGGNYTNHYGNSLKSKLSVLDDRNHPIARSTDALKIRPGGSLYKTAPLAAGSQILVQGAVPDQPAEPVAWTFIRSDGGRSFYTSLGHVDDFAQSEFEALLAAGIHWACGLEPHSLAEIQTQNARYSAGQGRQR